ncbi:hypothetical protein V2A60_009509 [Cordyceps javanica]
MELRSKLTQVIHGKYASISSIHHWPQEEKECPGQESTRIFATSVAANLGIDEEPVFWYFFEDQQKKPGYSCGDCKSSRSGHIAQEIRMSLGAINEDSNGKIKAKNGRGSNSMLMLDVDNGGNGYSSDQL